MKPSIPSDLRDFGCAPLGSPSLTRSLHTARQANRISRSPRAISAIFALGKPLARLDSPDRRTCVKHRYAADRPGLPSDRGLDGSLLPLNNAAATENDRNPAPPPSGPQLAGGTDPAPGLPPSQRPGQPQPWMRISPNPDPRRVPERALDETTWMYCALRIELQPPRAATVPTPEATPRRRASRCSHA